MSKQEDVGVQPHRNAFGVLRLALASLVIVAHTPELVDGNRQRELLTRLFGTITFGELAVDGFFVISGYLITAAFIKTPRIGTYLLNRIARIQPAFIVATLVSVLVVAPLGGAAQHEILLALPKAVRGLFTLAPPIVATAFTGNKYTVLNGSMWTIVYEFLCYLLVLTLGCLGALRYPKLVAAMAAVSLLAFILLPHPFWSGEPAFLTHNRNALDRALRLTGVFLSGTCFYLWRARIGYTKRGIIVSIVALFALLFTPMAHLAVATFGGYLIFAFAFGTTSAVLMAINNKNDISYGVYLYAWPIEQLLIWHYPEMPLLPLGLTTLAGALACGWISWHALEKPILLRVKGRRDIPSPTAPASRAGVA